MCAHEPDTGAAATEFTIAVPCLLLLLLLVVQFAVYAHATHLAEAVASRALAAARAEGAPDAAGTTVGQSLLTQLDGGALGEPVVTVQRSGGQVQVSVTGVAESVVPGVHLSVSATARGPVERFVPEG